MRIPNSIPLLIFVAFYIVAIVFRLPFGVMLWNTVSGFGILIGLTIFLFRNGIGGGVVKVMAALSVWLGLSTAFWLFLIYTAMLMGTWSAIHMGWRRLRGQQDHFLVPALPFVAIGFLLSFPSSRVFELIVPPDYADPLSAQVSNVGGVDVLTITACAALAVLSVVFVLARRKKPALAAPSKSSGIWGKIGRSRAKTPTAPLTVDPNRIKAMLSHGQRNSLGHTPLARPMPTPTPEQPQQAPTSFSDIAGAYARQAVIAYRPYPPHRAHHGRSKVGGHPHLPAGVPWPRTVSKGQYNEAGTALHFLAQIDLSELPWRPPECPDRGTLLFFARVDDLVWENEQNSDPRNEVQVIFDPASNGKSTPPPTDLAVIEDGDNLYDQAFSLPQRGVLRSYPEWPLNFAQFTSLPGAWAFKHKVDEGYRTSREQFYLHQLYEILPKVRSEHKPDRVIPVFETNEDRLTALRDPYRKLKSFEETDGFPYSPMFISLFAANMTARIARIGDPPGPSAEINAFQAELRGWSDWAATESIGRIEEKAGRDFIDFLNRYLTSDFKDKPLLIQGIQQSLKELVNWTGGNPDLAQALPDSLYHAVEYHPIWVLPEEGDFKLPEKLSRGFQHPYHQLFGHLSTVQYDNPADADIVLLLQLFTDQGADMMFCDVGDVNFTMRPEDFKTGRWDRVFGDTNGG